MGLKLHPPLLRFMGLRGLMEVAQSREYSVTYSPFGWVDEGGTMAIKTAPISKGLTEDGLARGTPSQRAIHGGLQRAKGISRKHTEEGVVIVNVRGRLKRMPTKSAEMMKEGERAGLIKAVIPA